MMLAQILLTEWIKSRRTLAVRAAVFAPLLVVGLQFVIGFSGAEEFLRRGRDFAPDLTQNRIMMWTLLTMPLFMTLETSWLAGLEHKDRNWKSLLALPVPRWAIYVSKLVVGILTLWLAHAVLCAGLLGAGWLLSWLRPGLLPGGMPLAPVLVPMAKISIGALLPFTIQHWVSLRWQSFTAALGFGMAAMIVGFVAANSNVWGPWVPWSMPVHLARGAGTTLPAAMLTSLAAAMAVAIYGAREFSVREITD